MTTAINGYAAVFRARFRMLLQYRAAAFAGFCTQLFWGLIRLMIFEAFYRAGSANGAAPPMTLAQTVTYIWLGQAMLGMTAWGVDNDVRAMIRSGTVAYELVRPLDLYTLWYSRGVAAKLAPTLLRSIPMFVVAGLFLGLHAPVSLGAGAGWAIATLGAALLSSAMTTLMTISLLWTLSGEGVTRIVPPLVNLFSGLIVPLPLYPAWSQPILAFLPFRGLMDTPFRIYLGHIGPEQMGLALAHQLLWTLALVALGRAVLARGTRRMVVQGG